jgi:hypothetical protein
MKTVVKIIFIAVLGAGGVYLWHVSSGQRTIRQLLTENKELQQSISNLSFEQQIGYAKVLDQEWREGRQFTRLVFVQTSAEDPAEPLLKKEVEIEGDVAHFDALIVRFGNELVMDGRARAICLWRRLYGEKMAPEEGFVLEQEGSEPAQYAKICGALSIRDRTLFWGEIWALSNDPKRLEPLGVTAIYGNVVYRQMKPGLIYVFKLSSTGALWPEVIPDL